MERNGKATADVLSDQEISQATLVTMKGHSWEIKP